MKFKLLSIMLLALIFTISTSFQIYAQQTEKPNKIEFPLGKWSFSYPPISRLGLADAPAQIVSTTGDVKDGGTITKVGLENLSSKTIAAIKFQWYLFREESPQKIAAQGETPVVGVGRFQPKETREVEYPIVSFGKIYKPLVKNGKLEGEFVIEVAVSEILYDDGSKWKR
jgi:hypothetical protein